MGNSVPAIVGIFAIAGMTIVCAACSKDEKRTVAYALKGIGIEDTVTVAEIEEAEAERPAAVAPVVPVECVVPAHLFRSMQCDEGGNLIPIR